jgi:HTH-type transcriptional regulator/antitoxin HipB
MRIRTIADLGANIRERRHQLGLDQAALAKAAGTSRKWLMEVERGKARAEVGLILKTLQALDLGLELSALPKVGAGRLAPKAKAIGDLLDSLKRQP